MSEPQRPLVIGLGSPHGDDQAGWVVVDRLLHRGAKGAQRARDGAEILMALEAQRDVVLVDASAPAGTPGCIRAFVWPCPELSQARLMSTHGLGLVEALRMAETLGRLPQRVTIVAVEAEVVAPGAPLSTAVACAIEGLTDQLLAGEVRPCTKPH